MTRVRMLAAAVSTCLFASLLGQQPSAGGQPAQGPIGELPRQVAGSAAGLSHTVPPESTRVDANRLPQRPEPHDAAPAAGGLGPDADRPVRRLEPQPPERADVRLGEPEAAPAHRGFDEATSVERVDRRSGSTQVFDNADGTTTLRTYQGPAFFQRPDGRWERIATRLVADEGTWRAEASALPVRFGGTTDAATLASVQLDRETTVAFGAAGTRGVPGRASGDEVVYEEARPGADLELRALPSGIKETIVLKSRDAATDWDFPLRLNGLTASIVDGGVRLTDPRGVLRAVIPPGYMEDSAVDANAGLGARSYGVTYELAGDTLRVRLDRDWLADPARVYPVRVDPSVFPVGANGTTYVQSPFTNDYSGNVDVFVGTYNGGTNKAAAYLKFDSIHTPLNGNYIMGAKLWMYETWAYSCDARPVYVHPVTQSWTVTGNKSWPGPSYGSLAGEASFAAGYSAACDVNGKWQGVELNAHGVATVHGWTHGSANHGLTVRASETDSYGWKKFASANSANPPYLEVTYTPYWADYQVGAMNPVLTTTQDGVMQVTVTNHGRDTWTPTNGYELTYRIWDGGGTELPLGTAASTPMPSTVAPGQSVLVNATVRTMPPGSYTLRWDMNHVGNALFSWTGAPMSPPVVFTVPNQSPVVDAMAPASNVSANTLTPTLRIAAHDRDTYPGTGLQYHFKLCDAEGDGLQNCTLSGWIGSDAWMPPAGALRWGRSYVWYATVGDGGATSPTSVGSYLTTQVPQPAITSHLASAATEAARGFDPGVGTYTTRAVDADIAVVGPDLSVVRTYNSLDPRRGNAFGAGWSSPWDTSLAVDTDGSGNVVVTYPDGQQARYGRHHDGTYAPPLGRFATLVAITGGWTLTTKGHTTFSYDTAGRLVSVADGFGRTQSLSYNGSGKLATVTDTASGRALTLTWTGAHVTQVVATSSPALTWTYDYTGDLLTEVCDPTTACTTYGYTGAHHYRTVVMDANPWGYWRLAEPSGATATNLVPVTGTAANGTYTDVTLGAPGAMSGSGIGSGTFNGTSSYLRLPDDTILGRTHLAVELWFRTTASGGGVLLGSGQHAPNDPAPTGHGMPILYVGTDGKLRGRFWNGDTTGIVSAGAVNDGNWHHVVLSGALDTQALYLDGTAVGTQSGVFHNVDRYNQVGAGWLPSQPWAAKPAGNWGHFAGQISDVAVYDHPLGASTVAEHWAGRLATDVLTEITAPGGRTAAQVTYSTADDRVTTHVDANGGTWTLGMPTPVDSTRTTVAVTDPSGDPTTYTYDPRRGGRLTTVTDSAATERRFAYDTGGYLASSAHWIMPPVTFVNDARGNVLSRSACRQYDYVAGTCPQRYTSYNTYYLNPADPLDPRNDRIVTHRDARSASATDDTYLTEYTYTTAGDPATTTVPGTATPQRRTTTTTYTTGTEPAEGGGTTPAGLVVSTTTPGNAVTTYAYTGSGDLARVVDPVGLVTTYGYDDLGRMTGSTVDGHTRTFDYDGASRLTEELAPTVTNAVTGAPHRLRTTTAYNTDGTVDEVVQEDVLGADPDRVTGYTYDSFGRTLTTTDPAGGVTRTEYDAHGALSRTVDPEGAERTYTYTPLGHRPATVTLKNFTGDGAAAHDVVLESRAYDLLGRLGNVTDAMGRTHGFAYWDDGLFAWSVILDYQDPITGVVANAFREIATYDGAGHLTIETDPNLHNTHRTWDPAGRISQVSRWAPGLKRFTEYTYDLDDGITRVVDKDPANAVTGRVDLTLDDLGRELTRTVHTGTTTLTTTTTIRDDRGLPATVTDPLGAVTTLTHDALGRLTTVTAPAVAVESGGGAPSTATPTSTTGLNTYGDVVTTEDPNGNVTHVTADPMGRPSTVTLPTYLPPSGGPALTPTSSVAHDLAGRVISRTDALGHATTYDHDELGNVVRRTDPVLPGQPAAGEWTATYDPLGERLSLTGPTGAQTFATYDKLGRAATSTVVERVPAPTRNLTTRYGYDGNGNRTTLITPAGRTLTATYDDLGNRTSLTDPDGEATVTAYDAPGRPVSVTDPLGNRTTATYDLAGRLVGTADLDAAAVLLRSSSFGYDDAGNRTSATDPLGVTTTYDHDALGRLTTVTRPVSGSASLVTGYGHDAAGNVTRVTDPNGNTTVHTVNPWNLPESVVEPATAATPAAADRTFTTSYDAAGRPRHLARPGGVTVTTAYDPMGHVTGQTGAGASISTPARVFGRDLLGRLTSANTPGGTTTIGHDDRGNVVSAGGSSYAWDADGLRSSATTSAGTTAYTYDTVGRLATAVDPLTGATATYDHDDAGQLTGIGYGAGAATRTFAHDALDRVISDEVRAPGGTVTSATTYDYDDADRLVGKTTTTGGTTVANTYDHDLAGRLTSWDDGSTVKTYTWDDAGNLTSDGATYDERNHLLSRAGTTYTYTPRGTVSSRTTGGTTITQAFNAYDELVTDGGSSYAYDGLNRLVTAGPRTLTYDGLSDAVTGDGVFDYTHTPGGDPLGVRTGGASSIARTDVHTDLVAQFTPSTGAVTGSRQYDPFGTPLAAAGTQPSLGYQHQWTDPTSGFVDMGARWYRPGTGTFASRDPYPLDPRDLANANRHAYAGGNPLTGIDPTGHLVPTRKDGGGSAAYTSVRLPNGANVSIGRFSRLPTSTPGRLKFTVSIRDLVIAGLGVAGGAAAGYYRLRADAPSSRDRIGGPGGSGGPGTWVGPGGSRGPGAPGRGPGAPGRGGSGGAGDGAPAPFFDARAAQVLASAMTPVARPPAVAAIAAHIQALIDAANNAAALDLGSLVPGGPDNPFHPGGTPPIPAGGPGTPAPLNVHLDDACATGGNWTTIDGLSHTRGAQVYTCGAPPAPGVDPVAVPSASDLAPGCADNSFTPDTPVLMANGTTKPISEVRLGDHVLATDPQTGRSGPRPVTHLIVGEGTKNLVTLTIDTDGPTGNNVGTLTATTNHPLWSPTTTTWTPAGHLKPGNTLTTPDGTPVRVVTTTHHQEARRVHNLTIANTHTYYVGVESTAVLAHNCGGLEDDRTYDAIDEQYGPEVAAGVDYNFRRSCTLCYNPAEAADHQIDGIGMDASGLAAYLASQGDMGMTHFDRRRPSATARRDHGRRDSRGRAVTVVRNSYMIHAYHQDLNDFHKFFRPLG
ncbi:MAG TPA: polymorphic toxin-type HINT domain-containing protein [Pseudonocardiaceae bacterium]